MGNINCGNRVRQVIPKLHWLDQRRVKHNQRVYENFHPSHPVASCCVIREYQGTNESVEIPDKLSILFSEDKYKK